MRKILLFGTAILVATSVLAFGGGGGKSRKSSTYRGVGVDSVGIHVGGEKKKCPSNSELVDGFCKCIDGYEDIDGGCFENCQSHEVRDEENNCACDNESGYYGNAGSCQSCMGDGKIIVDNQCACDEGYEKWKDICLEPCDSDLLRDRNGTCTVCQNGNVYLSYNEQPCDTETAVDGCVSNLDCDENQYCHFQSEGCYAPDRGTCLPLGNGTWHYYNGKSFLLSPIIHSPWHTWWSSEAWCKAKGLEMVTLDSLGIEGEFPYTYHLSEEEKKNLKQAFGSFGTWTRAEGGQSDLILYVYSEGVEVTGDCRAGGMSQILCQTNRPCPVGSYFRSGECVHECGEYEHVSEANHCVCNDGFVWKDGVCGCPENYYLSDGECVVCEEGLASSGGRTAKCGCPKNYYFLDGQCLECAEDETSVVGNLTTECTKIVCNYPNAASPVRFHYCCEAEDLQRSCYYMSDGDCDCPL